MSKWRPTLSGCTYIIPDIHGNYNLLNKILARILPLRKINNVEDKIIFLGDYIDRGRESYKVLDTLIKLKDQYDTNIICLMGNHELLLLEILDVAKQVYPDLIYDLDTTYKLWVKNGGYQTIYSYLKEAGIDEDPFHFNRHRIKDFIPKTHIKFLKSLLPYYITHEYMFVHAGMDMLKDFDDNTIMDFTWDRTLYKSVLDAISSGFNLPLKKIMVTGHNINGPVICDNFLMLNCDSQDQLLVVELNSMDAFFAYKNKNRLVKYILKETK